MISSYTPVDGELHADDYTGTSSYRPIVHVEAMIRIMITAHCKVLADEILVVALKTAKINSPPKFLAIQYITVCFIDLTNGH